MNLFALIAAVFTLGTAETLPGSLTINLDDTALSSHQSVVEGNGPYYILQLSLPPEVTTVSHAWLEMRMDVGAKEVGGWSDPAPVIEAYALEQAPVGEPNPSGFVRAQQPSARAVAAGPNRLVRLDITELVQRVLADPGANHGIVIGSLTADRRGIFTLRAGALGPGITGRLKVIY